MAGLWKMWSLSGGDLIMSGDGHKGWLAGIDFSPGGRQVRPPTFSHLPTSSPGFPRVLPTCQPDAEVTESAPGLLTPYLAFSRLLTLSLASPPALPAFSRSSPPALRMPPSRFGTSRNRDASRPLSSTHRFVNWPRASSTLAPRAPPVLYPSSKAVATCSPHLPAWPCPCHEQLLW